LSKGEAEEKDEGLKAEQNRETETEAMDLMQKQNLKQWA
jgi:hypothetical protein